MHIKPFHNNDKTVVCLSSKTRLVHGEKNGPTSQSFFRIRTITRVLSGFCSYLKVHSIKDENFYIQRTFALCHTDMDR